MRRRRREIKKQTQVIIIVIIVTKRKAGKTKGISKDRTKHTKQRNAHTQKVRTIFLMLFVVVNSSYLNNVRH